MSAFHELVAQLKACTNERQLLKVVSYISSNSKKLKLSDFDLDKLERVGMQKYDEFQRAGKGLISNSKIGSKKYDGYE